MIKEIKSIKEIVLELLDKYPETRNSDLVLYGFVLKKLGFSELAAIFLNEDYNLPNMESVRRARQLIQHKGIYLPDLRVQAQRKKEEIKVREAIPSLNAEDHVLKGQLEWCFEE